MSKIRVLVVDDAVVMRRMITESLNHDPGIEVVGAAAHGRIALAKIPQVNPDAVTLDIEMPEMDGLATLREIRKLYPKLPVIMFSTLTLRGAAATLDALAAGASDYVTKPGNIGSIIEGLERLEQELVPKIKLHCRHLLVAGPSMVPTAGERPTAVPLRPPSRLRGGVPVELVCLGTSTGGPSALADVFGSVPKDFPVPIVIVQHMPVLFTKMLAERLDQLGSVRFCEGADGQRVESGCAYIAPGGQHMEVCREGTRLRLRTNDGTPENSCRPAVDVLFRTVADACGAAALAVIMTGMGQDGLRGCRQIRERGGQVLAQDEASSVVWGMPGYVVQAGLADRVLPLGEIGGAMGRLASAHRTSAPAANLVKAIF
jgi:two-component system chemotaxis response regulator CheB